MRKSFLLFIPIFVVCLSCCQNGTGFRIKSGDIDSICIDCWRWDQGKKYHVVLDRHKGYISSCSVDSETDSVTIPIELNSYDVDEIKEYVTKIYIDNGDTPPHVKKKAERMLYSMPERMVTTIFAEDHCIADTFHLPTIREFEYQLSDDFQKLYYTIRSITRRY